MLGTGGLVTMAAAAALSCCGWLQSAIRRTMSSQTTSTIFNKSQSSQSSLLSVVSVSVHQWRGEGVGRSSVKLDQTAQRLEGLVRAACQVAVCRRDW